MKEAEEKITNLIDLGVEKILNLMKTPEIQEKKIISLESPTNSYIL